MSLYWQSIPVYNQGGEIVRDTKRARVPGGWLVIVSLNSGSAIGVGVTFYPDPEHVWDGHSLPDLEPEQASETTAAADAKD